VRFVYRALTCCGATFQNASTTHQLCNSVMSLVPHPSGPTTPCWQRHQALPPARFRLFPFRSPRSSTPAVLSRIAFAARTIRSARTTYGNRHRRQAGDSRARSSISTTSTPLTSPKRRNDRRRIEMGSRPHDSPNKALRPTKGGLEGRSLVIPCFAHSTTHRWLP
jgi:hypothetical protein